MTIPTTRGDAADAGALRSSSLTADLQVSVPNTLSYRPGLDGLRAVAVIAVIAYHLGHLRGGFVGVDLFFVLSGWLITSMLLRQTPGTSAELLRWWQRRVTRLTPAVAVVVIAVFVAFRTTPGLTLDGIATMTWWQNWHLIAEGTSYWGGTPSPLRHTWSLSIEEQFYLVWPAVLVGCVAVARRREWDTRRVVGVTAIVLATISFAWAALLAISTDDLSRVYFGTETRAGGLLVGCAAAALVRDRPRRAKVGTTRTAAAVAGAVVLLVACLVLDPAQRSTYLGGLLACSLASVALIIGASNRGPLERMLSVAPLRWLGVRSYALYLWSWPVQLLVEREWPDGGRWLRSALVVGVSVVLADLSQRFVEQPMRRPAGTWAEQLTPRRVAWAGGLVVLVATGWFASVSADPTDHRSIDAGESADMALADPVAPPESDPDVTTDPEAPSFESLGYHPLPADGMRVMVMGDSQAFVSSFLMQDDERPARFASIDLRAIIGCGVLDHDGWAHIDPNNGAVKPAPECAELSTAIDLGLQGQPDLVVWPIGAFEYLGWERDGVRLDALSPELADELVASITARAERVTAAGARLALVQWGCPGPDSLGVDKPGEFARRDPDYAPFINDVIERAAANVPGAIVVRPTAEVCVDGDPSGAPTEAKLAAMSDGIHVDDEDKAWWWNWVAGQLPAQ